MTLPQTYFAALVLTILSMLCWGSWANTFKMTGAWRFELFYFDYSLGVLLAAAIAAFTFGTMGSDGFQFMDDLLQTSKRSIFYGFLGGVVSIWRTCFWSPRSPLPGWRWHSLWGSGWPW